jgi:hypothetical protein
MDAVFACQVILDTVKKVSIGIAGRQHIFIASGGYKGKPPDFDALKGFTSCTWKF